MAIDTTELLALPPAEKMRLVELLWDSLGDESQQISVLKAVLAEANRRRDEMLTVPGIGLTETEMWQRVSIQQNG
ncbi:MAG: Addiction module component, CHP02574 [Planctomycetota bacterium]|nr:MAG: Addiction module component, CHP02574 [Planctomycetota bacterium]